MSDSFDVYYWQDSRWILEREFGPDQKVMALAEAAHIDSSTGKPTCVIISATDPKTGVASESLCFKSEKAKKQNLNAEALEKTSDKKKSTLNKNNAPVSKRDAPTSRSSSARSAPSSKTSSPRKVSAQATPSDEDGFGTVGQKPDTAKIIRKPKSPLLTKDAIEGILNVAISSFSIALTIAMIATIFGLFSVVAMTPSTGTGALLLIATSATSIQFYRGMKMSSAEQLAKKATATAAEAQALLALFRTPSARNQP